MPGLKRSLAAAALLLPVLGLGFPPGSPMSEFGPSQVSLGAYFDHSGQDLYEQPYPSLLNSTGLSLDYGPWPFLQFGLFAGAAEFDVGLPDSRLKDSAAFAYNTDYSFSGGGSLKAATPRFAAGTTRAVAFGSIAYLDSKDVPGNSKTGLVYNGGASIQFLFRGRLNLVLGGEYYAIYGDQTDARNGTTQPFGMSEADGVIDHLRGIVGVEYFFKGKNRPFVSVAFRPTGALGWHDELGIRNGSISISLGAMATLGKGKADAAGEDEPSLIDQ
jgi:hypothetical protein